MMGWNANSSSNIKPRTRPAPPRAASNQRSPDLRIHFVNRTWLLRVESFATSSLSLGYFANKRGSGTAEAEPGDRIPF
jgi:hypothetical protein